MIITTQTKDNGHTCIYLSSGKYLKRQGIWVKYAFAANNPLFVVFTILLRLKHDDKRKTYKLLNHLYEKLYAEANKNNPKK